MFKLLILATIAIAVVTARSKIDQKNGAIYGDKLAYPFNDYSWGARSLNNTEPVLSGTNSIKFMLQNFGGLYFSSRVPISRELYDGVSFYVNPASQWNAPSMSLQFSNEDGAMGPIIKLVSASDPSTSATGLATLPANRWTKVFVPLPRDGVAYGGIRIVTDVSQGEWIFVDQIELEVNGSNNTYPTIPTNSPHVHPSVEPFIPGHLYRASAAIADRQLGSNLGGFSFWTSEQSQVLNNERTWDFVGDSGRLFVLPGGNLLLSGVIAPVSELGKSCNTWDVNIVFRPISHNEAPMDIKQELAPEAYSNLGGPIDPSKWEYYSVVPSVSRWTGTQCNFGKSIIFKGMQFNMPAQIGNGANGKNSNFGLAVWLSFGDHNGTEYDQPIDINIDLTRLF
eukprot:gene17678-21077_t